MAPLFPPAATAPIRTLTLVRSSSASSSAGAGAAQQTHLPISSLPLVQGKRVVSRDAPHAPQGVRVGSSSSLLFNLPSAELDEEGGKSGSEKAEREKEEVEVRGSPWAKLVLCESPLLFSKHQQPLSFSLSLSDRQTDKSASLHLTLRARLLTSSLELFHCAAVRLHIDVTAPSDAHAHAEQPWRLGTLQLDAPLRDVRVSFESAHMVGAVVLTPLRGGAGEEPSEREHSEEKELGTEQEEEADLYLAGFHNVIIQVRKSASNAPSSSSRRTSLPEEEWITFRISSPPSSAPASTTADEPTQRLLTLEPSTSASLEGDDPVWTLDALSRRTNAGYVSLGANPRVRRGSFDSGVAV